MSGINSSRPGWSRRDVLKGGAAAIAAAYGLRPDWAMADIPLQFDGSNFKLAAPEPNPKSGGVLRYGITNRPPHFDVHQSGTINSLSAQAVMFDFRIGEISCPTKYFAEASSINFKRSVEYGVGYSFHGFEDRSYRGKLEMTLDRQGHLAVINVVSLEDLLKGLVPAEIPAKGTSHSVSENRRWNGLVQISFWSETKSRGSLFRLRE